MVLNGRGVAKDEARARPSTPRSATGLRPGLRRAGHPVRARPRRPQGRRRARKPSTPGACDAGNAGGCAGLGFMFEKGRGASPGPRRAPRPCVRKGVRRGRHAGVLQPLGAMFNAGRRVRLTTRARVWPLLDVLRRGPRHGLLRPRPHAGQGPGRAPGRGGAARAYARGCALGHAPSCAQGAEVAGRCSRSSSALHPSAPERRPQVRSSSFFSCFAIHFRSRCDSGARPFS